MDLLVLPGTSSRPREAPFAEGGRALVARVLASLGQEIFRLGVGGTSIDVQSAVPLEVGSSLWVRVESTPAGTVLRLLPPGPEPSSPPPPAAPLAALPPTPAEALERILAAAFRAEGLPLDRDLLAVASRFVSSEPAPPPAAARAAAHLVAHGVLPEGRAASGLAELAAGAPSLPRPEDLAALLRLARSGALPEAEPLLEHPLLLEGGRPAPERVEEIPRLLERAARALLESARRHLASEPRIVAVDAALERIAREASLARPAPRAEAAPPRAELEAVWDRVRDSVERGDRAEAVRVLDRELARLDEREVRELGLRLERHEERLLERDGVVREARSALREVEGALARAEASRLVRLTALADRQPVVYAGSAPVPGLVSGRLHVFRRRGGPGGPGLEEGVLSLYLDLETTALGRVTGWVRLSKKAVAIRFGVESEDVRAALEADKGSLVRALEGQGLVADVGVESERRAPDEPREAGLSFLGSIDLAGLAGRRIDTWI